MGAFTFYLVIFAWTEKFNNGLCTNFLWLCGLKSSHNSSSLINFGCEWTLTPNVEMTSSCSMWHRKNSLLLSVNRPIRFHSYILIFKNTSTILSLVRVSISKWYAVIETLCMQNNQNIRPFLDWWFKKVGYHGNWIITSCCQSTKPRKIRLIPIS